MIIRLSKIQQRDLFEWSGKITAAHMEKDCLPPGYELVISIAPVFASAEARYGSETLFLGDVDVITE